jgi:integrase
MGVSWAMLHPFRRHLKRCKKKRRDSDCKCPLHYEGVFNGAYVRGSLDLTDFTAAYAKIREWEITGKIGGSMSVKTISAATETLLKDFKSKGRHRVTCGKYELLFKQLQYFARQRNLNNLSEITYDHLVDFRAQWTEAPITRAKKTERLRSFFRLAHNAGWISSNPSFPLSPGKAAKEPEDPFSTEDLAAIDTAISKFDLKLKIFEKLLRFTGMRISDAVTFKASELIGNRVAMSAHKNKRRAAIPVPPWFADAIRGLPHKGGMYFWRGTTKRIESECDWWRDEMNKVFKEAQVAGAHCHRYRHTFVCTCLDSGCSFEQISSMTGTSIALLQKHYGSYRKIFQDQLQEQMSKVWQTKLVRVK